MTLLQKLRIHQTRVQIFVGFILVMMITLILTFSIFYYMFSNVLRDNTTNYIDEISKQTSGHLESLLNEINVLTLQLAMDERLHEILSKELHHEMATYDDRMEIRRLLDDKIGYSNTIKDIEIYSNIRSLYPIVDQTIVDRVGEKYVHESGQPFTIGSLVWMGLDQEDPEYIVGIRQVLLEKEDYKNGGYLLVRVKPSLIDFIESDVSHIEGSAILLLDGERQLISTVDQNHRLSMNEEEYLTINRNIESTNWTLSMLIPKTVTDKETNLLKGILVSALIFSILLFAIMSYFLSRMITFPIKDLTITMQKGSQGQLQTNDAEYFNDEINELNTVYNKMVEQIKHLIQSVYEKEIIKSQSEVKALQSQINPHFLFNTLDMIYWDLVRKGDKHLSDVVLKLARLFRYTIKSNMDDGFVTVKDELEHIERYTDIMQLRLQQRLSVHISIPSEIEDVKIPKLILQPMIENAIKYGIEPLEDGGKISLETVINEGSISFIIKDNGAGMQAETLHLIQKNLQNGVNQQIVSKGTGIGIFNVHKLIQIHYGEQYGVNIDSARNKGTTVVITIPKGDELE